MTKIDPDIKGLLDKAGVSASEFEDTDTANFIYDFINKNGGIDAVKAQQPRSAPPPAFNAPGIVSSVSEDYFPILSKTSAFASSLLNPHACIKFISLTTLHCITRKERVN